MYHQHGGRRLRALFTLRPWGVAQGGAGAAVWPVGVHNAAGEDYEQACFESMLYCTMLRDPHGQPAPQK